MIQRNKNGFTLLELLIAISIFSVISIMAYGGLKTVLDARDASKKVAVRVAESQLAMLRLSNDLQQAVDRSIRDGFGDNLASMLTLSEDNALEWTKAGYSNPERLKRSSLQRISYKLIENNLVRVTWPVLDRAQDTKPNVSILLSDIDSIKWRFNASAGNWSSDWPVITATSGAVPFSLPRAVEVTITFSDLGEVRRLMLIPQA